MAYTRFFLHTSVRGAAGWEMQHGLPRHLQISGNSPGGARLSADVRHAGSDQSPFNFPRAETEPDALGPRWEKGWPHNSPGCQFY